MFGIVNLSSLKLVLLNAFKSILLSIIGLSDKSISLSFNKPLYELDSIYGYSETVYITHLPIQKVDDYFIDGSARSLQIWSYTPGKCEGLSEGMKEQC
jgi:hypothetical protein